MKSAVWSVGLLLALGGCSTVHQEPVKPHSPLLPLPAVPDSNTSLSAGDKNAPFCPATLPQDLDIELPEYALKVGDLERFEQSLSPYLDMNTSDHDSLTESQSRFEQFYFTPWQNCSPSMRIEDVTWPLRAFKGGFANNLRPVNPEWLQEIQIQSNFEAYGTLNKKAIAIRWADIRALPTDKPLYKNPALPGEGYPFDLLQNSSLNYNEPVFVSHTSKDGAWSYIFTNSVSGWVKSDGLAWLDDESIAEYSSREKLFVVDDNIPLYDGANRFLTYSRIGMVLALQSEEGKNYRALAFNADGSKSEIVIPKKSAHLGISKLNKNDLARIGGQMLKNTYGWGGMYGERDCSSMIRDMYTPFGIWLPRNSSAQSKRGEIVSFDGLSNDEKLALIKEKGIPFETIIYLKGHVLLYIGINQGNPMMLHNIWGIRTIDKDGNKGRHIVGKAVISTLEIGSELENFDLNNKLLTRAQSMNIFTKTPAPILLTRGVKSTKKGKKL